MRQEKVLNQGLYDRLRAVFGEVRIHNQGEPFQASVNRRAFSVPGRRDQYLRIGAPGEYYAVNCPVCGDRRHRLWINHRWNTNFKGVQLGHLIRCYNENCDELDDFRETITDLIRPDSSMTAIPDTAPAEVEVKTYKYPGTTIKISELPVTHPARQYLTETRDFDAAILDETWGVRFVVEPEHRLIFAHNRIVIPIYDQVGPDLVMKGWQTRYFDSTRKSDIPESKRTPKYCTEGNVSKLVYNLYRASKAETIVVCEGVFDVMRIGPNNGVCTFGKTLSEAQAEQIENRFLAAGGKRVIFAYHPDVSAKGWEKVQKRVQAWPDVRYVNFPDDYDLADYPQAEISKWLKGVINE